MKADLKISTFAIVSVLCTAMSATAASTVRTLGGAGTYNSASSAAAANDASVRPATRAATSVRGGGVRVNPSTNTGGTVTRLEAGAGSDRGSVASPSRLSIGKYLGGGASSVGAVVRPQGGLAGDSMGPGSAGSEAIKTLEEAIKTKQDRLVAGEYITINQGNNTIDVKAEKFMKTEDAYTKDEVDSMIPDTSELATKKELGALESTVAGKADADAVETLAGQVADKADASAVEALTKQVETLTGGAAGGTTIAGLAGLVSELQETTDGLVAKDTALEKGISDNTTAIADLKKTVTDDYVTKDNFLGVTGELALQEDLEKKADKTDVDSLSDKVTALEALTGTEGGTTLAGLASDVAENTAAIATLNGTGAGSVSKSVSDAIDALDLANNYAAKDDVAANAAAIAENAKSITDMDAAYKAADAQVLADAKAYADANVYDDSTLVASVTANAEKIGLAVLDTEAKDLSAAINELVEKTTGIASNANLEALAGRVNTLETDITTKADIDDLEAAELLIAGNTDDIAANTKSISDLEAVVGDAESGLVKELKETADLAAQGLNLHTQQFAELAGADGRVTKNEQAIAALTQTDNSLQSQISELLGDGSTKSLTEIEAELEDLSDAKNVATNAEIVAGEAKEAADAATIAANNASTAAAKAEAAANAATQAAEDATTNANTAVTTASDAKGIASTAATTADAAKKAADEAKAAVDSKAEQSALDAEIAARQAGDAALQATIDALEIPEGLSLTELNTSVTEVTADLEEVNQNITNVNGKVTKVEADLSGVTEEITGIKADMASKLTVDSTEPVMSGVPYMLMFDENGVAVPVMIEIADEYTEEASISQ